jgi:hypothetical protein
MTIIQNLADRHARYLYKSSPLPHVTRVDDVAFQAGLRGGDAMSLRNFSQGCIGV